jgi:hypothetical protein
MHRSRPAQKGSRNARRKRVIASEAKPSEPGLLDCFVAALLAMTGLIPGAAKPHRDLK